MAIQALEQVTKVRKLILQAERSGVHLDYGAYKFMNALEKVVGEKQIGEFEQEPCTDAVSRADVIELIERGVGENKVTIGDLTFGKSLMLYHVKQLPSVTPKQTSYCGAEMVEK